MRKLAFLIVPLLLVGCSKEPAEQPMAEDTPAPAETAAMVTANGSQPGTYDVVNADGTKGTAVLNADGTYTETSADGTAVSGTWAVTDGKTCFTPAEGEVLCWTEGAAGADGSFTATSDKGETVTVAPQVAAAAPAEEAPAAAE